MPGIRRIKLYVTPRNADRLLQISQNMANSITRTSPLAKIQQKFATFVNSWMIAVRCAPLKAA